jgi:adenylate kinase family enzyme
MQRIVVIGNAGTGKSTLSRRLGALLGIEVCHLDSILWKPGWQRTSDAEFIERQAEILRRERWIIDGLGVWDAIRPRLDAADTIIFPDYPLWISYLWAYKRQAQYAFRPRPDLPPNCPMLPKTWQLGGVIRRVHTTIRPRLLLLLAEYQPHKRVFQLRSPQEMQRFVAEIERAHHH